LTRPKEDIFFANLAYLKEPLALLTESIKGSSCEQVGLRIDSNDPEYPYWWLLDAPESGTRIETIYSLPGLDHYQDSSFKPCAIICTICGDHKRIHGLNRVNSFDDITLYMGSDYNKELDG
jgi:hypothetical protein